MGALAVAVWALIGAGCASSTKGGSALGRADTLSERATADMKARRWDKAADAYTEALAEYEDARDAAAAGSEQYDSLLLKTAASYAQRAECYRRLDKYALTLQDLERALQLREAGCRTALRSETRLRFCDQASASRGALAATKKQALDRGVAGKDR